MTDRRGAPATAAAGFPAPGSRVAGAPPALKRVLTPADGVLHAPPVAEVATAAVPAADLRRPSLSSFTAAAAMAGIAVGLELARLSRGAR
ncbi:hypothetical protein [Mycobacterium sp. Root265]|uniref:hypothetical protein n=1 Tax=Mycobacterium sp. Root265 TaxID=1736504 RepID=UPI0012E3F9FA|nr:hypothetical protein [Mycobacterium sp. Root265]